MKLEASEHDTQSAILHYLVLKGYFCWRNNTGAFAGEYKGKAWYIRTGKVGSGDIIGLNKEGKFFSIEVKRKGNKATVDQENFIRRVQESNGISFTAYDLQDVIDHGL